MPQDVLPNYSSSINLLNAFLKKNKNSLIDGHGHIFSMEYIPEDYLDFKGVLPFLDKHRTVLKDLIFAMQKLWPFSDKDALERKADFLKTSAKTQQEILDEWLSGYAAAKGVKKAWAVAPMTLDFEFGFHEKPEFDYWEQIKEVGELAQKKEYSGRVLPFVFADPRRGDLIGVINHAIGDLGYVGIKTYPSLGFLPSHPKLLPVWERMAELGLPVLSHCGPGGLRTKDSFIKVQGYRKTGDGYRYEDKTMFFTDKPIPLAREWLQFFNHPEKWEYVLEQNKNKGKKGFKLCLAHLGSSVEVEKYVKGKKGSWFEYILGLAKEYPGFYFDVAYESYRPEIIKFVCDELLAKDPVIAKKIIFGTDFYMTHGEKKYKDVLGDALKGYAPYLEQIARENFLAFVTPD